MSKLKLGDRVACYGISYDSLRHLGSYGVCKSVTDTEVAVLIDGYESTLLFHPKQCRKLKPKNKPREFWINIYTDIETDYYTYNSEDYANKCSGTTRLECVHVREVRKR